MAKRKRTRMSSDEIAKRLELARQYVSEGKTIVAACRKARVGASNWHRYKNGKAKAAAKAKPDEPLRNRLANEVIDLQRLVIELQQQLLAVRS